MLSTAHVDVFFVNLVVVEVVGFEVVGVVAVAVTIPNTHTYKYFSWDLGDRCLRVSVFLRV